MASRGTSPGAGAARWCISTAPPDLAGAWATANAKIPPVSSTCGHIPIAVAMAMAMERGRQNRRTRAIYCNPAGLGVASGTVVTLFPRQVFSSVLVPFYRACESRPHGGRRLQGRAADGSMRCSRISTVLACVLALAGASCSRPPSPMAVPAAAMETSGDQALRLRGGAPGRKLSPAQQAAGIPQEAFKFSARYSEQLTGGASSLASAPAAPASAEVSGGAGPVVVSDSITEIHTYNPRLIHRSDPWRRALVNDEPFDISSKGRNMLVGNTIILPLLPLSLPLSLPLALIPMPMWLIPPQVFLVKGRLLQ